MLLYCGEMTLTARNALFLTATVITGFALAATALGVVLIAPVDPDPVLRIATETMDWLFWEWSSQPTMPLVALAVALGLGMVAFVGMVVFQRLFRRAASPEILFVAVFVISLAVEQLRLVQYILVAGEYPLHFGALVSRALRFGHVLGALSLFTASLYAAGTDYARVGSVLTFLLLLAFAIVYFMPVDALELTPLLMHRVGMGQSLDILLSVLWALTVINYVFGAVRAVRDDSTLLAACVATVVVGRGLLMYVPTMATAVVGGGLLIGGLVIYAWTNRLYYLWY